MRIAVAGGTGVVGQYVVEHARSAGHEVVALSRSAGVDVYAGTGLDAALAGVDSVIDVLNVTTQRAEAARDFFTTTSRHLLEAEQRAGCRHHVLLSIVGIEQVPMGYYQGKVAQEQTVAAGATPWTVLRATQFHEFAGQMLERMGLGPLALVPALLCQPVAASEVASRLVDLAAGPAVGRAPDLGGPERRSLVAMARDQVKTTGSDGAASRRRIVVPLRLPGVAGRAVRSGALCVPERDPGPRGTQTFEEWLVDHSGPR